MASNWAPIKISRQLVLEGGFSNKAWKLEVKEVETFNGVEDFVKIDKRQEWLVKAAAGKSARPGALSRTKLFDEMKRMLAEAAKCASPAPAVAASAEDPMEALATLEPPEVTPKRRKVYVSKRRVNLVTEIEMLELEPTKHPTSQRMRAVKLLPLSTNSLWLSAADVGWLVCWLADELETGGVPMESAVADHEAGLEGNCQAPGIHIRWDFDGAWEAVILEGRQKGKSVKSFVDKLTLEKWEKADAVHKYKTTFEDATREQLKSATYHFLEMYCQEVLQSQMPSPAVAAGGGVRAAAAVAARPRQA